MNREDKRDTIDNFIIFLSSDEGERKWMRKVLEQYLDAEEEFGYNEEE